MGMRQAGVVRKKRRALTAENIRCRIRAKE